MLKMPRMRKTKKQKILAEYHRKLQTLQTPQTNPAPTISYQAPKIITTPAPIAVKSTDYSYVSSDLKRIGLWATLAIGAQFVLWYLLGKHLLS